MAALEDMEGPAPTLDDALLVLEQFLAGQVHQDVLLATVAGVTAADPGAAHRIQEQIDAALRAGELADPVWERITAELDHAFSEEAPTERQDNDTTATQSVEEDVARDALSTAPTAEPSGPPVLDQVAAETPSVDEEQPAKELNPGTILSDRYVIVSQAHSGGMGHVYKALDRTRKEAGDSDPWVAVKIVGQDFADHPQGIAALEREADACKSLQHDNIVRVFDFERDGDTCFITMEWLEGESLASLLERARRKPTSPAQLRRIILSLGAALDYAHSKGMTHADVKPGNVFVTHDGTVKLLDFGVALAQTGERYVDAHTPAYSSCEVLEGQLPEPSDDLFSYCLLIYRLLAGKRAFGTSTALEAEASQQQPERIPNLANQAWEALLSGLRFRRRCRASNVASFLEAFTAPPPAASKDKPAQTEPSPAPVHDAQTAATNAASSLPSETADKQLDANPETPIAPMDVDDLEASGARWKRPALIAASVAACVAAGAWLMTGDSEAPPVARAFEIPAGETREAPARRDPLAPVSVQAPRLEDVFPIDVDAQPQDLLVRPTDTGLDASSAPEVSDSELEAAPEPNAQLASVAGAPAVSPTTRTAGSLADVESPATAAKLEQAPSAEPADVSPGSAPGKATAATAARADSAPELTGDLAENQQPAGGEMPALGPPMTSGPASGPNDYGPAPAAVDAGPLAVTMSELEFDRFAEPKYPRSRDARNTRGWVQLEFTVNADGSTSDVRVAESSPPGVFDEAAMTAARKWRFKPYTVNGETVPVMSIVRLRFEPR